MFEEKKFTSEDLKGLSHEEFVKLVLELQEKAERAEMARKFAYENFTKYCDKYNSLRDTIKGVITLSE